MCAVNAKPRGTVSLSEFIGGGTVAQTKQPKTPAEPVLCSRSSGCVFFKADDTRLTCDGFRTKCTAYTSVKVTKKTDLTLCRNVENCGHYNGWAYGDRCDGHNLKCRSYVTFYEVVPCNLGKCSHRCNECAPFRKWADEHTERRLKASEVVN